MRTNLWQASVVLLILSANTVRGQEAANIPKNVLSSWSYLIGQWDVDGSIRSDQVEGSAQFRWADGKYCYTGEQVWKIGEDGRVVKLMLLGGWDESKNATVEHGFTSLGTAGSSELAPPEEEAEVSRGRFEVTRGPDAQFTGTIELERRGPDEFQLTTRVDGQVVHSLRYRRTKPAATPSPGPDDGQ
jgi:hypothetical protein